MSAPEVPAPPPWGVVRVLSVTQTLAWASLYYAIAVLAPAIEADTGWRRDWVMGGFTLALFVQGAAALPAGLAIDRFGGRVVMTAGSVLGALALAALAASPGLGLFWLAWALAGAAMAATLYEPAFATITATFGPLSRRAITIVTLAGGLASTLSFPVSLWLLQRFGWRATFAAWAVLQLLACLPLHWFGLPSIRGGRAARRPVHLRGVLRAPAYWFATAALALGGLVTTAIGVHSIPILQEKGFGAEGAVALASLIGPMQVAGRVLEFGPLGRLRPTWVAVVCAGAVPASLLCLLAAGGSWWIATAFVVLYGAANGVMTIVRGALPADLFGREGYGGIAGAMATPAMFARAIAPFAAGVGWTVFGGYGPVLLGLIAIGLGSLVAFVLAARTAPARAG
ncbi:MAG: MFS transporter [Acetobacteraceae bacterium]|nr:MFS transporter [Acetobacteraceae bacterium]